MTELTIAHKERAHSAVGGSSAKRVLNCTASVALCAEYPNVETSFAAEGTAMHEAIDLILMGKTEKDTDVVGLTLNDIVITQAMFDDGIAPALEYLDGLDKELGGVDFYVEKRVVFPGIEDAFGTVDIIGKAKDRTIVLDWKFGRGVAVEAEHNEQLMYYAYAAAHTAPTNKFFVEGQPIELFIVQPRVNDGEPYTRWVTTMLQLEAFALELRRAVEISATSEATYKLGSWCKFCNAKTGCDLYNGVISNAVVTIENRGSSPLENDVRQWLPYADDLIKFGDTIKQMAHELMEQGVEFDDWKLVNKRANRSWSDETKALAFMARMRLPAADRYEKKIISPAKAEKVLKPLGVSAIPDNLIDRVSSGTTLAPASDKRPSVAIPSGALKLLAERLGAA